jgi:hypothetical protein
MGVDALVEEAVALGFHRESARQAMTWTVARIALRTGVLHADDITEDHIDEALEAVRLFSERGDLHFFYPSAQKYDDNAQKLWVTHPHELHVALFHCGQVPTRPRKKMPDRKPPLALTCCATTSPSSTRRRQRRPRRRRSEVRDTARGDRRLAEEQLPQDRA